MSSLSYEAAGAAAAAQEAHVPTLVADKVASRIFALDPTLWGPDAESESAIRLGWTKAPEVSRALVEPIEALRAELAAEGVSHVVLCGMGGSSLAPEVITGTAGVELTVLDSTDPEQVAAALADRLEQTVVVVSSKSGSTVETDSQRRAFLAAFEAAGIDGKSRIVIVTDPGSPLDKDSRAAGYRAVFNADPHVGGRFSALTAFGLVPSGLAGVDINALLDEAEETLEFLAEDAEENIGLKLGAALGGTSPLRNKIVLVDAGSGIVGFADWAEQLIAESTGKIGRGLLPVVAPTDAPELTLDAADVLIAKLVSANDDEAASGNEVRIGGGLGSQMVVWEFAIAVAGRLLGINPFDQPDVEAAKVAARGLLDARPEPVPADFTDGAVEVRLGNSGSSATTLDGALKDLLGKLGTDGYLSVQAYLDRLAYPQLEGVRNTLVEVTGRPTTFGWGPRFLHSTGQFHKGGPAIGVFLQITAEANTDVTIPERPFTFGQLINAQAAGDAQVLAEHHVPVLRLHFTDRAAGVEQFITAINALKA